MINVYEIIFKEFKDNPRDVITMPKNGVGKWFYVYVKKESVYIEGGKIHNNISKISSARRLNPEEAEEMLDLYHRRCKGESVSQIAQEITVNQVYWYGIFAELGL